MNEPGTYADHDGLHPSVKGSVAVQRPPPAVTLDIGSPIVTYGNSTTLVKPTIQTDYVATWKITQSQAAT